MGWVGLGHTKWTHGQLWRAGLVSDAVGPVSISLVPEDRRPVALSSEVGFDDTFYYFGNETDSRLADS